MEPQVCRGTLQAMPDKNAGNSKALSRPTRPELFLFLNICVYSRSFAEEF